MIKIEYGYTFIFNLTLFKVNYFDSNGSVKKLVDFFDFLSNYLFCGVFG